MSTTSSSNARPTGAQSRVHLGAAYYPEHWPEDRWTQDIQLMREAGLTVARLAEFAWSTLEPVEGEFHLGIGFRWHCVRAGDTYCRAACVAGAATPRPAGCR
jgi:beta-galactosidase